MKYKILKNDHIDIKHPKTKKPVRLYRILALKSFECKVGTVAEGSIGGFVADETNLNQNDSSWLFNQAKIFDNALLVDSVLLDNAVACQNAIIQDSVCRVQALVLGDVTISNSLVTNGATVDGSAIISDSKLFDSVRVWGSPKIERSVLHDGVVVRDHAQVTRCVLRDTVLIMGTSNIENCQYSGYISINNSIHKNETRRQDVELNIIQQIFDENISAIR